MKLLVTVLLYCSLAFGQGGQTLYSKLFTNLLAVPSFSGPINQIGNRAHTFYALMFNHAPNICTSPQAVDVGLDASFDGVTWTPTGPQVVSIATDSSGNIATLLTGLGAFPFIRFAARNFNTVNCTMTVWYSGTVGTFPAIDPNIGSLIPAPPTFIYINNLTTGNSTTYTVYSPTTSDTRQITLKGPINSPAVETGTFNGNPYTNPLGNTDASGNLQTDLNYVPADTGTYNTIIRVGTGQIGITRNYQVN